MTNQIDCLVGLAVMGVRWSFLISVTLFFKRRSAKGVVTHSSAWRSNSGRGAITSEDYPHL